jgi:hypothetical protein
MAMKVAGPRDPSIMEPADEQTAKGIHRLIIALVIVEAGMKMEGRSALCVQ